MPIDINLNVNYTTAQRTAIETDLNDAKSGIDGVLVNPLNLSDEERSTTPSVDEQREKYVNDGVVNLAPLYPRILGPEISAARALELWQFRNTNLALLAIVDEIRDRLIDSTINAENLCLKFTEDMRDNAMRYKERNVPGADVVWDRLKGLHTVTPNPVPQPA